MQPRIYTYKITFEVVPYYYYGVHKEKKFNEYYMGSPRTHKWCWELYTSKKQILEFFEYDDTGFLKAQEIEKQLIKPVYQTDKWCLNENCGGKISTKISKLTGIKNYELGIGLFSRTYEDMSNQGKINGTRTFIEKTGIHSLSPEEIQINAILGGEKSRDLKLGIHGLNDEQRSENAKKAGIISYQNNKHLKRGFLNLPDEVRSEISKNNGKTLFENKLGCFSLSPEERTEISRKVGLKAKSEKTGMFAMTLEEKSELMKKTNSQKWRCLVTGHIANAGNLAKFQKIKGIDVKLKERLE